MENKIIEQQRIALNLKMLRMIHNLTQNQVSRDTGIPRGTLAAYERCGEISRERLEKLADYYEVPMEFMTTTWNKLQVKVPRAYIS